MPKFLSLKDRYMNVKFKWADTGIDASGRWLRIHYDSDWFLLRDPDDIQTVLDYCSDNRIKTNETDAPQE